MEFLYALFNRQGMKKISLCLLVAVVACSGPIGNPQVPEPEKPVELSRYLGRWYEIARYENRFEKGCEGVTAEYALLKDGKISVMNRCRKNGTFDEAKGKAKIVENSGNAKLRISFFGPFYLGNYWVLDHAEDYSWSIVGENSGRYLWILAREPKLSNARKAELLSKVKSLGYNLDLLHETVQP